MLPDGNPGARHQGVRADHNIMLLLKIIAILVFVTFASTFIHPANYHPFAPNAGRES